MEARTLNRRYRLDEIIGEGGMAVVYRGYDTLLNRIVAIKLLRAQYGADDNFLKRFEREAQSVARLSHPNIVNVYDVGQDGDSRYIVMEYVDGRNLKELIRRQGPFSVDGATYIIRQVAGALDYAHAHGIIHRDIKPQNILVDQEGNVKVADFGIAKGLSDATLTEVGIGMGTVHYVSPEQARGEHAVPGSDIYATGVVLYEMLTKRVPFEADAPVGVAMQHVNSAPPPPSQFNPALTPGVEAVVLRALAKDPADRFPTATALADALERRETNPAAGATRAMPTTVMAGPPPVDRRPPTRSHQHAVPPRDYPESAAKRSGANYAAWLIGSAILIGLVGVLFLAFQLGGFAFFEGDPANSPTPVVNASPSPSPSPPASPSPSPSPSPTPEMTSVPSLIGSTEDQALAAAADFNLVITYEFSNSREAGTVIRQNPTAAEVREKGSDINVVISRGPEYISLSDIAGMPVSEAQNSLEGQGFTVTIEEDASETVPQGHVIRTEPSAQVQNGGTVTLFVSVGDQVLVPDVYGKSHVLAKKELENAGLTVVNDDPQSCTKIKQDAPEFDCETFPNGGVVSGSLQWNTWVPAGSSINIAYFDASKK